MIPIHFFRLVDDIIAILCTYGNKMGIGNIKFINQQSKFIFYIGVDRLIPIYHIHLVNTEYYMTNIQEGSDIGMSDSLLKYPFPRINKYYCQICSTGTGNHISCIPVSYTHLTLPTNREV